MKGITFIPEDVNFNFMKLRHMAFVISAMIILGSIALTAQKGLNFGIDFTGGTLIEIRTPETPDLSVLRTELNGLGLGGISIQEFGAPDDLLIRLPQQNAEEGEDEAALQNAAIDTVRATLDERYGEGAVDYRRTEYVGPQVGEELKRQGMYAVLFSILGILAYIWFRFEWQYGIAAIVALAHDCISVLGLFAFTQMQFDLATVAAILMIAGYSINDTVVVFDRIRENLRKYKRKPLGEVFNMAINQTLSRTIITGVTTLLALIALWAFGGEVIAGFIKALIFGILIGTYSSIFIASPVLLYLNVKRSEVPAGDANVQEA